MPCPDHAAQIRSCFTGLYPLDESKEGLAAVQLGISRPEDFVLKPQREGGGMIFLLGFIEFEELFNMS